jgi:hypothetical protein
MLDPNDAEQALARHHRDTRDLRCGILGFLALSAFGCILLTGFCIMFYVEARNMEKRDLNFQDVPPPISTSDNPETE